MMQVGKKRRFFYEGLTLTFWGISSFQVVLMEEEKEKKQRGLGWRW
jgi:hypothetical protein